MAALLSMRDQRDSPQQVVFYGMVWLRDSFPVHSAFGKPVRFRPAKSRVCVVRRSRVNGWKPIEPMPEWTTCMDLRSGPGQRWVLYWCSLSGQVLPKIWRHACDVSGHSATSLACWEGRSCIAPLRTGGTDFTISAQRCLKRVACPLSGLSAAHNARYMNEEVQADFPPKSTAPVSSNYVCRYAYVPGQAFDCLAVLSVKCKQMMYLRGSDAGDLTSSENFHLACSEYLHVA